MESLPPELVEIIAKHLTVKELAACCATSHAWRDIFSDNRLWKPHCNREIADHLETLDRCVEPAFVPPETEDSFLSPLAEWQLHYMREQYLWSNWRQGRWKTEDLAVNCPSKKTETEITLLFLCMFVTNDYLITSLGKTISLWDVRKSPQYVSEPFKFVVDIPVELFKLISNNKIVVAQSGIVVVLNFGSPMKSVWTVEHAFFVFEAATIPFDQMEALLSHDHFAFAYFSAIAIGVLFVSVLNSGALHVWDLDLGKKLGVFYCGCFEYGLVCKTVVGAGQSKDFAVMMCKDLKEYSIVIFSLTSLAFFPLKITLKLEVGVRADCALLDQFIAVKFSDSFRLYNYHTSQLVLVIPVDCVHHVLTVDNYFLLVTMDTIHLFNTFSGEYDSVYLPLTEGFEQITSVDELFCGRFVQTNHAKGALVWEIHTESTSCSVQITKLQKFVYNFYKINRACTKLAICRSNKTIKIATLW